LPAKGNKITFCRAADQHRRKKAADRLSEKEDKNGGIKNE